MWHLRSFREARKERKKVYPRPNPCTEYNGPQRVLFSPADNTSGIPGEFKQIARSRDYYWKSRPRMLFKQRATWRELLGRTEERLHWLFHGFPPQNSILNPLELGKKSASNSIDPREFIREFTSSRHRVFRPVDTGSRFTKPVKSAERDPRGVRDEKADVHQRRIPPHERKNRQDTRSLSDKSTRDI